MSAIFPVNRVISMPFPFGALSAGLEATILVIASFFLEVVEEEIKWNEMTINSRRLFLYSKLMLNLENLEEDCSIVAKNKHSSNLITFCIETMQTSDPLFIDQE